LYLWQEFRQPTSLREAIEDLQNSPIPVYPIAGGTDLLLEIRQGGKKPAHTLIDLTGVQELSVIDEREGWLFIGACVPVNRIINSLLTQQHAQALIEACDLIAGPQVRNVATLGGNVAHALPAADGTIALTALNAKTEIASSIGMRMVSISELFGGPGKSTIDRSSELITGFYIPYTIKTQASAFKRIMRPQGVALPILNCAVWLQRSHGLIEDVRIAIGPGGPTPFRATLAEEILREKPFNEEHFGKALQAILDEAKFRTSPRRATLEYRRYEVSSLFKDTLNTAWERAVCKK